MDKDIAPLVAFPRGLVALSIVGAACTVSSPAPVLPRGDAPVSIEERAPADERATTPSSEEAAAEERFDPQVLLDTWSLAAREDGEACRAALKEAGFQFRSVADKSEPDKSGCGIPHGVIVRRGPTGIVWDPPIMVDCTLARALVSVERIVQEEAERHLETRIARIANLGGYACRPRNYRKGASLSAHAFGSAVDVAAFHPAKGTPAIIARDWAERPRSTPARDARRSFLRSVFVRLRREADLTYVVGPDFNAIHHDHFHLDRGGWHFWFNR